MTICADIDAAVEKAQRAGLGLASLKLRMGRAALYALAADAGLAEEPTLYDGIVIERVESPSGPWQAPTSTHFHGWELVT